MQDNGDGPRDDGGGKIVTLRRPRPPSPVRVVRLNVPLFPDHARQRESVQQGLKAFRGIERFLNDHRDPEVANAHIRGSVKTLNATLAELMDNKKSRKIR